MKRSFLNALEERAAILRARVLHHANDTRAMVRVGSVIVCPDQVIPSRHATHMIAERSPLNAFDHYQGDLD